VIYDILIPAHVKEQISLLKKSDLQAYKKLLALLAELTEHPYTGTGKPEKLKYDYAGFYARKIIDMQLEAFKKEACEKIYQGKNPLSKNVRSLRGRWMIFARATRYMFGRLTAWDVLSSKSLKT
jgi:Txe/YoeB family toxin of Txe-Axe toxin-antitoxin module